MFRIFFIFFFLSICIGGQEKSYPEIDSALKNKNFSFAKAGKHTEGIEFNLKLIETSRRKNYTKGIGWGYLNIGNFYCTLNQYQESLKYLELAENELSKTEDITLKAKLEIEFGKVNNFLGLYDIALKHYNNGIALSKKDDQSKLNPTFVSYMYACKATNFINLNQPDSLYFYLKKAYKLCPDPIVANNIANYFINYKKEQIDSAKFYLEAANTKLKTNDYPIFQKLAVLKGFGNFYYEKKDYYKALDYYTQSLAICKKIKKEDQKINLLLRISKTYKALKNKEKAEQYLLEYTVLNDSLNSKNNEALNLSVDKLVNDSDQEAEKDKDQIQKSNYLVMGFAAFGMIILGTFSYIYYIRKKKEKDTVIYSQQQTIVQSDTEKRKLEHQVNNAFDEVLQLAKKNDPAFLARFKEVYPEFCENLISKCPDLLKSEFTFCGYLKLNLSTKDIANYTFVTEKAVQGRKSRLRKRMNISSQEDLYVWINRI